MGAVEDIKQRIRIEDYIQRCGFTLERHGTHRYRAKEHDSLVIVPDKQKFYWNSQGISGDVIDFAMYINGIERKEAIKHLAAMLGEYSNVTPRPLEPQPKPEVPTEVVLPPEKKEYWKRLYGYLLKKRCLDKRVVDWLAHNHLIYPDDCANVVYISRGVDGKVEYAARKGTGTPKPGQKGFRRVCDGGNYTARAAWCLDTATKGWFICEAAVDAWSIMSIIAMRGEDFTQYGYISLDCCNVPPIEYHLQRHDHPPKIWLAQDADSAGDNSRIKAIELLDRLGYQGEVINCSPPPGLDWNEYLQRNGVKIVIEEQAIRVEVSAARIAGRGIIDVLQLVMQRLEQRQYGEQSMRQLNKQGRQLVPVDVDNSTIRTVKQQMKQYAVDFAITKEKDTDKMFLWFKAQDVDRVEQALKNCIAACKDEKGPKLEQICEKAKEQAATVNQQHQEKPLPTPEIGERT